MIEFFAIPGAMVVTAGSILGVHKLFDSKPRPKRQVLQQNAKVNQEKVRKKSNSR